MLVIRYAQELRQERREHPDDVELNDTNRIIERQLVAK